MGFAGFVRALALFVIRRRRVAGMMVVMFLRVFAVPVGFVMVFVSVARRRASSEAGHHGDQEEKVGEAVHGRKRR